MEVSAGSCESTRPTQRALLGKPAASAILPNDETRPRGILLTVSSSRSRASWFESVGNANSSDPIRAALVYQEVALLCLPRVANNADTRGHCPALKLFCRRIETY